MDADKPTEEPIKTDCPYHNGREKVCELSCEYKSEFKCPLESIYYY